MAERTKRGLLHLDRWRVVVTIAAVLAVAAIIAFVVVFVRLNRVDAARAASAKASYDACLTSIPLLAKINNEFEAAEVVGQVIYVNAVSTHMVTDAGSKQYRQQQVNIQRLRVALSRGGVRLPVPTTATCEANRDRALEG